MGWARNLDAAGVRGVTLSTRRMTAGQRRTWAAQCSGFQVLEPTDSWNLARNAILVGAGARGLRHALHPVLSRSQNSRKPGGRTPRPQSVGAETRLDLWASRHLARRLERLASDIDLRIVHALRIPFEGIAATMANTDLPIVVSTWGSDLQVQATGRIAEHARRTLLRCDGFMADNSADVNLAEAFGLPKRTPRLVVPGNMGLDVQSMIGVLHTSSSFRSPMRHPLVVYPRGMSGYMDVETFLQSIPLILKNRPDCKFICVGLTGHRSARNMARAIGSSITLVDFMSQSDLWRVFSDAAVVVSPGRSDGLPNSVLEATSLGAIPVVYDLPSVNEILASPVHGYSVGHGDAADMARAVVSALSIPSEIRQANMKEMASRFGDAQGCERVMDFYNDIIGQFGCSK